MFSLFGAGMENSDAARMVGEWGCNNIILGGWATILTQNLFSVVYCQKAKEACEKPKAFVDKILQVEILCSS